jgi:hypothetical protein
MTPLTVFGLFAVTAMLVCYACESRSHWFTFAFAVGCVLGSAYGGLQGLGPSRSPKASGALLPLADGGSRRHSGEPAAGDTLTPVFRLRVPEIGLAIRLTATRLFAAGAAYPALLWTVSRVVLPHQAEGSLVYGVTSLALTF